MRNGIKVEMCGPGRAVRWILLSLLACSLTLCVHAQDDVAGIPTLRVYANLLQIPTLVLDSQRHRPIPAIAEHRFVVSIDDGPKSHVTHVRLEGEDPIALAILVDAERVPANMAAKLRDAIAGLAPKSLHPADTLSLYNLDCQLGRVVVERPTTSESLLTSAELMFGQPKGKVHAGEGCKRQWNLLDAIVSASEGLKNEPGRRVLLVLTDGVDRGSRTTWDATRAYATEQGVAIFGLLTSADVRMPFVGPRGMMGVQTMSATTNLPPLCESTGGMALDRTDNGLTTQLRDFVALVRSRYIVEFPKPEAGAGAHRLDISVEKLVAFIRPAGASVPVADPDLAKDPNNILPDPANAPVVGTKRPKQ